jgi:hypothetical protein
MELAAAAASIRGGQLGVDYTYVLDVQFGCAFHRRMRFRCYLLVFDTENYIENAFDRKTHIQTAHTKHASVIDPLECQTGCTFCLCLHGDDGANCSQRMSRIRSVHPVYKGRNSISFCEGHLRRHGIRKIGVPL